MRKKYTHSNVVRQGKKDGRDWKWKFWPFVKKEKPQKPDDNDKIAEFENELAEMGEAFIVDVNEKWKKTDFELHPEYCELLKSRDHAAEELKNLTVEKNVSDTAFQTAKTEFLKFDPPDMSAKWMYFWLVIISLSEFFINSLVLQVFGQGKLETYVASLGICVMLPIFAHFFGKTLQYTHKTKPDIIWLFVDIISMLALLWVISILRNQFFEGSEVNSLLNLHLNSNTSIIIFFVINISLFFAAAILSHQGSHPKHKIYIKARKRYKTTLKQLEKDSQEMKAELKKLENIEQKLQRLFQNRKIEHEKFVQEAKSIKEDYEWLISSYRASNTRQRKVKPTCFEQPIRTITIPDDLIKINWGCENTEDSKLLKTN